MRHKHAQGKSYFFVNWTGKRVQDRYQLSFLGKSGVIRIMPLLSLLTLDSNLHFSRWLEICNPSWNHLIVLKHDWHLSICDAKMPAMCQRSFIHSNIMQVNRTSKRFLDYSQTKTKTHLLKLALLLKVLRVNRVLGQMDSFVWHSYNYATEMHAKYKRDRLITAEIIPIVIFFSL